MEDINILLVERTKTDLQQTRAYLASNPMFHIIGSCTSVEQAYALSRIHQPDLIICELILFGADGLSLLRRLSQTPDRPSFLLTSSLTSDPVLQNATASGVDYFLHKPYLPQQLIEAVTMIACHRRPKCLPARESDFHGIYRLLIQSGYTSNTHGFHYLATGIHLVLENPELLSNLTKLLYVQIAERHDTRASRVERDIRHAIRVTSARTGMPTLSNGTMIRSLIRALQKEKLCHRRRI